MSKPQIKIHKAFAEFNNFLGSLEAFEKFMELKFILWMKENNPAAYTDFCLEFGTNLAKEAEQKLGVK